MRDKLEKFIRRRLNAEERFGLTLTAGIVLAAIFSLLFLAIVHNIVDQESLLQFDANILHAVQSLRTPALNGVMLFATYVAQWNMVAVGVVIAGISFWLISRRSYALTLLLSVVGGQMFVWIVKHLVNRPRPSVLGALLTEESLSFPSGHSFAAFSFYGLIVYFLFRLARTKSKKTLILACGVLIASAIGLSRIYLGVHWPSDVLASFAAGAAWLSGFITAMEIQRKFYATGEKQTALTQRTELKIGMLVAIWIFYAVYFYISHPLTKGL